jgi:hypothetical protein
MYVKRQDQKLRRFQKTVTKCPLAMYVFFNHTFVHSDLPFRYPVLLVDSYAPTVK